MSKMHWNVIFFVITLVSSVSCMALNGTAVTRYDPCGLGAIQFDKTLVDRVWLGTINFIAYANLTHAEVELNFMESASIVWTSQDIGVLIKNNSRDLVIKPLGVIPPKLRFNILVHGQNKIPILRQYSMNNIVYCNDNVKKAQTAESLDVIKPEDKSHKHICGRRSMNHTEVITMGADAKDGEWPWHVAIFIKDINDPKKMAYQCGGSIISETEILTAGHCLSRNGTDTDKDRVVILAGTTNITNPRAIGLQKFIAKKIIIHPNYTDEAATADLAIITVDKIKYTEYVQPVCLWGPEHDKTKLYGVYATMVGFGKTEKNVLSTTLRASSLVIQNDNACIAYSNKLYTSLLNEYTFCAGFGPQVGINPRNGDSGGGLVVAVQQPDYKISYFVRGVLSKCGLRIGATSCDPNYYVVYTNVAAYYSWILSHMAETASR